MKRDLSHNAHYPTRVTAKGPVMPVLRLAGLIFVLCLLQMPDFAAGQKFVEDPYKVEAAFLRNFARYVTWPAGAFAHARSPWRVGILGRDPFGDVLEKT